MTRPRHRADGRLPVVLVVGATASGKSALALHLARHFDGEIISADAMAVYRGMDIGTAKPDAATRAALPHHLIDCFAPGERCDVNRWLGLADEAVRAITARGRLPIVAGGSPLYAKALLEGLSAGAPRDDAVREKLNADYDRRGGEALLAELYRVDPDYAGQRHANDRKRIVRALEVHALTGQAYSTFHTTDGVRRTDLDPLLIGLDWERAALHQRINRRAKDMFAAGLVGEVANLRPHLSPEALQAVGYKEVLDLLDGHIDAERALYLVSRNTRALARHQCTWYRRWRDIRWLPGAAADLPAQAVEVVAAFLSAPAAPTAAGAPAASPAATPGAAGNPER
jgi:tRNA dimethylallyltransferase